MLQIYTPPPVFRPSATIRTYSRNNSSARAQSPAAAASIPPKKRPPPRPPASAELETVPPCHATLVGFRGLLLQVRPMFQLIDPSGNRQFKYRDDRDDTLRNGIDHPDLAIGVEAVLGPRAAGAAAAAVGSDPGTASAKEAADKLLFHRLRALFFWPNEMCKVKSRIIFDSVRAH